MCKDVVEELAARGVFEDDANVLVRFNDVVQTDDVWVLEGLCVPSSASPCIAGEKG